MSKVRSVAAPRCLHARRISHHRGYHSHEHPPTPAFTPTENTILSAALAHVPTHGFTPLALTHGARQAGYLDISTNLFPTGAFALVHYHLLTQRLALASHFSPKPTPSENIPSKITRLALHRLRANKPIIRRWQAALALSAQPSYLPTALKELALLSDEILYLAGSTTVTGAWYTDRAAVSAIYASAELFMTQDESREFEETEKFLERRMQEAEGLKTGLGFMGQWLGMQAVGAVGGLRSKGVWI